MATYGLEEKLAQLQKLTEEAAARNVTQGSNTDVWRPNLDLSTALYSRSVPAQSQRIALLDQELVEIEEENSRLYSRLRKVMSSEEELRSEANDALQCLDETIEGLETSPELAKQIRESITLLSEKLGPRSVPTRTREPT
ncbi:hypothetical protein CBS101457_001712 [Exobasidium rhododendri]|nr:hypothetical protein CBS101457_001712 [Exobasidium rhododendri]